MNTASKFRHLGRVATDYRWILFYIQRRFMGYRIRYRLANILAKLLRPQVKRLQEASIITVDRVSELRGAGITQLGTLLTEFQVNELQLYFLQKPVTDPYRVSEGSYLPESNARNPDSHIAHHDAKDILKAPYLLSIANQPEILDVVEGLLGCKPTLSYLAVWWSYHTGKGAQQAEQFHRDVDDWRFVKLFIYLTDVDSNNGPHIYVSHSSSSPKLRQIQRYTDQDVITAFGADQILKLTGRAGTGFLEDTFGMHKGQPVEAGKRLVFQAVYSMYPLPYAPKVPVISAGEIELLSGTLLDKWTNRLYVRN